MSSLALAFNGPFVSHGFLAEVLEGDFFSFTGLVLYLKIGDGLVVDGHQGGHGVFAAEFVFYQQLYAIGLVFGKCIYKIQVLRYGAAVDQPLGIVVVGRGIGEADPHGHATLAVFGKIKGGHGLGKHGDLCGEGVIGTAIVIEGNEAGHVRTVTAIQVAGVAVDGTHAIAKIPDVSITVQ